MLSISQKGSVLCNGFLAGSWYQPSLQDPQNVPVPALVLLGSQGLHIHSLASFQPPRAGGLARGGPAGLQPDHFSVGLELLS